MRKKILLTILVLFLLIPLYAKVNVSVSSGADFSHNLLYEEEILFRTSGRFSLQFDLFNPASAKFSVNPYVKISFLTHSMTYNYTRTLGSYSASGGIKIKFPFQSNALIYFAAGAGAGFYRTFNFNTGYSHDGTSKNPSFIRFGLLEASAGIDIRLSPLLLSFEVGGIYQKDNIRWHISTGIGILF